MEIFGLFRPSLAISEARKISLLGMSVLKKSRLKKIKPVPQIEKTPPSKRERSDLKMGAI
jgi:hypothetical protein